MPARVGRNVPGARAIGTGFVAGGGRASTPRRPVQYQHGIYNAVDRQTKSVAAHIVVVMHITVG
jgi:hypothetical protein